MTKNHTLQRTDTHARTRTHTDTNIHTQHTRHKRPAASTPAPPLNQQEWEEPAGGGGAPESGGGAMEMCLGELILCHVKLLCCFWRKFELHNNSYFYRFFL
ncbi:unnamed protein product [Gadus morhua 'NCC']